MLPETHEKIKEALINMPIRECSEKIAQELLANPRAFACLILRVFDGQVYFSPDKGRHARQD
jgi:hypothetical protein